MNSLRLTEYLERIERRLKVLAFTRGATAFTVGTGYGITSDSPAT